MTRSEVRTFIKSGVNALVPAIGFSDGLVTEFNSERSNKYPTIHLVLEETNTDLKQSAPQDDWPVKLIISKLDKTDSLAIDYEELVDECHLLSQKLIYSYRNVISGYKLVTMDGIKRVKFIHKYADCLTGIELSFTIHAPDQTNVC